MVVLVLAELAERGLPSPVGHPAGQPTESVPLYYYEDEDGQGRAVPTKYYTGLVGTLFRGRRESEIVQNVHRTRPLLGDETVHGYLFTNVPTPLPIDRVATYEELADPLRAMLPVPDGAITLLEHVHDVVAGDGPDGFRASELVEQRGDGTVANKTQGYHRLARLCGMDVCQRTVYNYVEALEELGLLDPEEYEQRAGVSYVADFSTLQSVLTLLSSNGRFKVDAVRRFRDLAAGADGSLSWLQWARDVFGGPGEPPDGAVGGVPPPD